MVSNYKKYQFSSDLIKLLDLDPTQSFSYKEIKSMITPNHINIATKLFTDLKSSCNCGHCYVNINDFMKYIKKNLIINNTKPFCDYYEFNQKPLQVKELINFEQI